MKIFFNGDSHTAGDEIHNMDDVYPNITAKLLNAEVVGNYSLGGCPNERIIRTTDNYLEKCIEFPDLIVIGWSQTFRREWFFNGEFNNLGYGVPINKALIYDEERFYKESKNLPLSYETVSIQTKLHHIDIYNYHCKLTYLKIPHIFFNACQCFYDMIYPKKTKDFNHSYLEIPFREENLNDNWDINSNYFYEYDWNNSFWNPYGYDDASFINYGLKRKYKFSKYGHFEPAAHYDFAHTLSEYIKTNNIVS